MENAFALTFAFSAIAALLCWFDAGSVLYTGPVAIFWSLAMSIVALRKGIFREVLVPALYPVAAVIVGFLQIVILRLDNPRRRCRWPSS